MVGTEPCVRAATPVTTVAAFGTCTTERVVDMRYVLISALVFPVASTAPVLLITEEFRDQTRACARTGAAIGWRARVQNYFSAYGGVGLGPELE